LCGLAYKVFKEMRFVKKWFDLVADATEAELRLEKERAEVESTSVMPVLGECFELGDEFLLHFWACVDFSAGFFPVG
jgi:hypothetical protein